MSHEQSDHPEVKVTVHVYQHSCAIYTVSLQSVREIKDPNIVSLAILLVLSKNLIDYFLTL